MRQDVEHYKAVMQGKRSKVAGEYWETLIENACTFYRERGLAEITKTPEPMRPIGKLNNRVFKAVFTKQAQPDYKGTLKGGQAVVFEAKYTDKDRLLQSCITGEQEKQLNSHLELGAECFVLVSFGLQCYFKIPWEVFRNMKAFYGRKYITPADVQEYAIKFTGGVLRFL